MNLQLSITIKSREHLSRMLHFYNIPIREKPIRIYRNAVQIPKITLRVIQIYQKEVLSRQVPALHQPHKYQVRIPYGQFGLSIRNGIDVLNIHVLLFIDFVLCIFDIK